MMQPQDDLFGSLRTDTPSWASMDGPRTAYTHGPEGLVLGPQGKAHLGPIFADSTAAAEDARRTATLRKESRVVYKLVPVSYHRQASGRVD